MAYTGNQGKVEINSVTYEVTNWSLTEGVGVIDTTKQGSTAPEARSFISDGLRNTTGSIEFDCLSDKQPPRATVGAAVAFELQDEHQKYTGNCLITNVSKSVPVGDKVTATVDIQVSGDVTVAAGDLL